MESEALMKALVAIVGVSLQMNKGRRNPPGPHGAGDWDWLVLTANGLVTAVLAVVTIIALLIACIVVPPGMVLHKATESGAGALWTFLKKRKRRK